MSKRICVIGTGYVGLVTAIGLADFGNHVTGADIDNKKIKALQSGQSPIYETGIEKYLSRNIESGRLKFTTNVNAAIRDSEVVFIGVGTPSLDNGEADLTQVMNVADSIAENMSNYTVIVTKSTVPVGTNRMLKRRISEHTDVEFDIVSNPEFLREGKAILDFFNPDRVIIGYESEKAKDIMDEVYRTLRINQTPIIWSNLETAELIKYASNAFLATKITFVNQVANLAESVGADIHKITKAMGMDGRISNKFLHPGPGYGGSCFPKDTRALVRIGKSFNVNMSLVNEVVNANEGQKQYIARRVIDLLGGTENQTIAVLGLAFKAETDDMRESPSISIIRYLADKGINIHANDPKSMENASGILPESVTYFDDEYDAVRNADMLLILTEWNEYRNMDMNRIKSLMKGCIVYDTRNILDKEKAIKLGFKYHARGR